MIRVIVSNDGDSWTSTALLSEDSIDLRDPKISIMPDGRLLLLMGGTSLQNNVKETRSPRVAFSNDGWSWSPNKKLLAEDHWLWRVTWKDNIGYCVSKLGEGTNPRRGFLYRTSNALEWEWVTEFILPNNTWTVSETTLRIMPDDEMIALIRPNWIGTSRPPYTNWSFTQLEADLGGPNFILLPNRSLWASARGMRPDGKPITVLAQMTRNSYAPVLALPSGGDCSYPGMVWHDGMLWVSYYSSHEGQTSIYLAKIAIQ
tara:strand:- start:2588 stop:3364 length:777 start_codon:yes stop_codon:yes gene_type:complete